MVILVSILSIKFVSNTILSILKMKKILQQEIQLIKSWLKNIGIVSWPVLPDFFSEIRRNSGGTPKKILIFL